MKSWHASAGWETRTAVVTINIMFLSTINRETGVSTSRELNATGSTIKGGGGRWEGEERRIFRPDRKTYATWDIQASHLHERLTICVCVGASDTTDPGKNAPSTQHGQMETTGGAESRILRWYVCRPDKEASMYRLPVRTKGTRALIRTGLYNVKSACRKRKNGTAQEVLQQKASAGQDAVAGGAGWVRQARTRAGSKTRKCR